jgi:hypothetical protein
MGNRFITITLLAVILSIFTLYFILRDSVLAPGQPIQGRLQNIIENARLNKWAAAARQARLLQEAWERQKYLMLFNYAEADYQTFEDNMYVLTAAVEAKDAFETVSRAKIGQKLWENFSKIIPEP